MSRCCYDPAFKNAEPQVDCAECCDDSYDFDWGTEEPCVPCPDSCTSESNCADQSQKKQNLAAKKKQYQIVDI